MIKVYKLLHKKIHKFIIIIIIIMPLFTLCTLFKFQYLNDSQDIYGQVYEITADNFILAWDKPASSNPDYYNIYYKDHASTNWILLTNTTSLTHQILFSNLISTVYEYDFGITAIYGSSESILHYCLDSYAEPSTGWYIRWVF